VFGIGAGGFLPGRFGNGSGMGMGGGGLMQTPNPLASFTQGAANLAGGGPLAPAVLTGGMAGIPGAGVAGGEAAHLAQGAGAAKAGLMPSLLDGAAGFASKLLGTEIDPLMLLSRGGRSQVGSALIAHGFDNLLNGELSKALGAPLAQTMLGQSSFQPRKKRPTSGVISPRGDQ
jgi:hypothetical protein